MHVGISTLTISPFVQCDMFFAVVLDHYVIHFYPTLIQRFYHNANNVMTVPKASQRPHNEKRFKISVGCKHNISRRTFGLVDTVEFF